MSNLENSNLLNLSRRSFIVGGSALMATAGVGLVGCSKKTGDIKTSGKLIRASLSCGSSYYSPVGNYSTLMVSAGWHVFEALYDYDLANNTIMPVLADGAPVLEDETTYIVKLRDGAKFSDGKSVTSVDVVGSFQANMRNETYKSFLGFIKSVESVDKNHVKFILNYPFQEYFRARTSIVRIYESGQTDEQLNHKPIGSGPWAYTSINGDEGGQITFVPNKYYNGNWSAGEASMEWTVTTEDDTRISRLNSGAADIIDDIAVSSVDTPIDSSMKIASELGASSTYMMFNTLKEPFNDKRVRQALQYLVNNQKIVTDLKHGQAASASCILPENHYAYKKSVNVYDYDPIRAKKLLNEAGVEDLSVNIIFNNDFTKNIANQIKEDFESLGIETTTTVKKIDWKDFNEAKGILPFDIIIATGDPSMLGNDPDLFISWQYEDNVWMNGRSCFKKSDPDAYQEIQDLMQKMRETTGDESSNYLNQLMDKIAIECPVYPLFHRYNASAYNDKKILFYNPIPCAGIRLLGTSVKQ